MLFRKKKFEKGSNTPAYASWVPISTEEKALDNHGYVEALGRIDQMWPWLESKKKCDCS